MNDSLGRISSRTYHQSKPQTSLLGPYQPAPKTPRPSLLGAYQQPGAMTHQASLLGSYQQLSFTGDRQQEVSFLTSDQVTLYGDLTTPLTRAKHPAIIFVWGSGRASRAESPKHFATLAKHFARLGFATLLLDKRGCGRSEGEFSPSTTMDFAHDVEQAIDFLHTLTNIDHQKIGLFGHSEGGLIAAMVGAKRQDLAYLMFYGAPGMKISELLDIRRIGMVKSNLRIEKKAAKKWDLFLKIDDAINQYMVENPVSEQETLLYAKLLVTEISLKEGLSPKESDFYLKHIVEPYKTTSFAWTRAFRALKPYEYFEQLSNASVLVVNGETDFLVPPQFNIPVIRDALKQSGNRDTRIAVLPGIGHGYAACSYFGSDCLASDIDPQLLEVFTKWLRER